jgi:hypothetical protein
VRAGDLFVVRISMRRTPEVEPSRNRDAPGHREYRRERERDVRGLLGDVDRGPRITP